MQDIDEHLIKTTPFFQSLSEVALRELMRNVTIIHLPKSSILFHEGDLSDAIYIVKSGAIRITTLDSSGKTIFLARLKEGNFFGETALSTFYSPRRRATASAQVDTILYKISSEILLKLNCIDPPLKNALHNQDLQYLKSKLIKLADSNLMKANIDEIFNHALNFPHRSVIFYKNDPAKNIYILVSGEIELRLYDKLNQISQVINIGLGQVFGSEAISENKFYRYEAVAKKDSEVIVLDASEYHNIVDSTPLLKELSATLNKEFPFQSDGKILQFRGRYDNLPATTSIITFHNGREFICQQVIGANIFFISSIIIKPNKTIKYQQNDSSSRELSLFDNKLVGVIDYGLWDDSYKMLDLIANEFELTEPHQQRFIETGKIDIQEESNLVDKEFVCKCMRVTKNQISKLIKQNKDFSGISNETGAGTICGSCRPIIMEMLGTNVWNPCIIKRIIHRNDHVKSFQIQPVDGKVVPAKAGQYIIIKAKINNQWVQRNYTLTSSPDINMYEITVKKEPKGLFSPWLFEQIDKDTLVYVAGPYGEFTLDCANKKSFIFIVGGIGVTPALAFTRALLTDKNQKYYIDYSVRHPEQFIFDAEFDQILKENPQIMINKRVTSISGSITEEEIIKIIHAINDCHIFVCGPKGLEELVVQTCKKLNYDPDKIHVEQFYHSGAPDNMVQEISLD